MGLWSSFKKGLDTVFYIRPKKWISWDFISDNTKKNYNVVKKVFTIQEPERKETFLQAMHRHGLNDGQVKKLAQKYTYYSYFFLAMGLGIFLYGVQGLISGHLAQFLGSFCLTSFILSMAFRYNFWAYQIKVKKLGCTFAQWWGYVCGSKQQSE